MVSSSEQIAKDLKGAGLSTEARIEAATRAWRSSDIFFPNKDDFLFEWLCTALVKANLKDLSECSLLQIGYWELLCDLLEHYATIARKDHHTDRRLPTIRVHMVVAIGNFLQCLYIESYKDTKKRVKLLQFVQRSTEILLSDTFAIVYRPAFDHLAITVDHLLTGLEMQLKLCEDNGNENEKEAMDAIVPLSLVLLNRFDLQVVQAANQKKAFTTIVGKSFLKFLFVRRRIPNEELSRKLTEILIHTFFHTDTVLEYTSVVKEQKGQKQASYVGKLFDTLMDAVLKSANNDHLLDALDILPVLLKGFVHAFRAKRSDVSVPSASQAGDRMIEFEFFGKELKILKEAEQKDRTAYVRMLEQMLKVVAELNMYNAQQDDNEKTQTKVLESISTEMVAYLNNSTVDQGLVLNLAGTLLQVDFALVESNIKLLWPVVLQPTKNAESSCLDLSTALLHTYAAARQLDLFIEDLLGTLEATNCEDADKLLNMPLFSNQFLQRFSLCISKHMPPAQAEGVFEQFATYLNSSLTSSGGGTLSRLISLIAVAFIKTLRLSNQQGKRFQKATVDLFQSFVKPALKLTDPQYALAAMQIHFALTNTLFEVYWKALPSQDRTWLINTCSFIFNLSLQQNTSASSVAIVTAANVMLQHTYLNHLISGEDTPHDESVDLVNAVVDLVIGKSGSDTTWRQTQSWNGLLNQVKDTNTVKLACWKLITDEWFDTVCRTVDSDRAEKLATMILSSLPEAPVCIENGGVINVPSLNAILLRSANFYEARCFKDCSITIVMKTLIELFATQLQKQCCNQTSKQLAAMIACIQPRQAYNTSTVDVSSLYSILTAESMKYIMQDGATQRSMSTENVKKVAAFIQLWLLFPIEYYEKIDRQYGLLLSLLVDAWIVSSADAEPLTRIKASLMCRTLYLRIIKFTSASNLLGTDALLLGWILQSSEYWTSCDLSTGPVELDSLKKVTHELDHNTLLAVISRAGAKCPETAATEFFKDTLNWRYEHLKLASPKFAVDALDWIANLLVTLNQYIGNHTKRPANVEFLEATQVVLSLRNLSTMVVEKLHQAKIALESNLAHSNAKDIDLPQLDRILLVAKLLQELSQNLGSQCEHVLDAKALMREILGLTSPIIQYLQLSLCGKVSGSILELTSAFIAALCTTFSRYPHINSTKRVLAVIWLVYSLISRAASKTQVSISVNSTVPAVQAVQEPSLNTLTSAFSTWVQTLTADQYEVLVLGFVEQAEEEVSHRQDGDRTDSQWTFISLLSLLLSSSSEGQKSILRKSMPTCVLKLSILMGTTTSVEFLIQSLTFLLRLSKEKALQLSKYDVNLVLACLLQVASPATQQRLRGQVDRLTAHRLFENICSILMNLVHSNRMSLVSSLPTLTALLQALLHCFKSTHLSLVNRTKIRKEKAQQQPVAHRTVALLFAHAPLDESAAQQYTRLLSQLPQKTVGVDTRSAQTHAMFYRAMARHAPYLLYEYFTIQSNPTMSIALPRLKSALMPGLYNVMDMCTGDDHTLLMAMLDGPAKGFLKTFYSSWKAEHKYTGQ